MREREHSKTSDLKGKLFFFFLSSSLQSPLQRLRLLIAPVRLGHGHSLGSELAALSLALEVSGAVEPGVVAAHLLLEVGDLVLELHGEADVVEALDEAVLAELLDLEGADGVAAGVADHR